MGDKQVDDIIIEDEKSSSTLNHESDRTGKMIYIVLHFVKTIELINSLNLHCSPKIQ